MKRRIALARTVGAGTAPVYPGERLKFYLWRDSDVVSFRAIVPQRNVVVLDHGRAELR